MSANKKWWGPRIWRILHCLAEISDRQDCIVGWRIVLQHTIRILPCEICRSHFSSALRSLRMPSIGSGKNPRENLRDFLWKTHTNSKQLATDREKDTNENENENEINFLKESLTEEYGYGGDRSLVVAEVHRLITEIVTEFRRESVLDRFQIGFLEEWNRSVTHLANLLLVCEPDSHQKKQLRIGGGSRRTR